MTPLRNRLEQARQRFGAPWEVLERDYLLSWILAGIDRVPVLGRKLVLKGGTALRKCYFGDYRFSEDLDFSALDGIATGDAMEVHVQAACAAGEQMLADYAPIAITCERYVEREPHPRGQEAFSIRAQLPWQNRPHTRVMIEVTMDEPIFRPIERRRIIHEYGEPLEKCVPVYALAEVVAEKLRVILQQAALFKARGWGRSRARDFYDLWRILGEYGERMDLSNFDDLLREKCSVRQVTFDGPDDFFHESILIHVERTWTQWLGPLVSALPPFETVVRTLRSHVTDLIGQPRHHDGRSDS